MSDAIETRIRQSFGAQSMMTSLGAELTHVSQGTVSITAPVGPGVQQQQGFGHAALSFAIGDSAAGYAALTLMPPEVEVMTAEIKINLLAPAQGRLLATGRVIKPGRRLMVVAADVWAEQPDAPRRHVAMLQGTMVPVSL